MVGRRKAKEAARGGHCKYTYQDKFGTPYEITFKDGRKLAGLLFVMGNAADEMMVEIGDSETYSNVSLCTISRIERRKTEGERHIFDFASAGGEKFTVYGFAGNLLFFKTSFGIVELQMREIESMIAPPPAPKKAASAPAATGGESSSKTDAAKAAESSPRKETAAASQSDHCTTKAASAPGE